MEGARAQAARLLQAARRAAAELFLPMTCVSCERLLDSGEPGIVCGRCWARMPVLPYPQCERCGHPAGRHTCRWCGMLPPFVRAVRSVCWVDNGTGASIVHALKYGGWSRAAEGMGERMARLAWPVDVSAERVALVPVPLAPARERERGYNQSELLAAALAPRWGVPVWRDALRRVRVTATQTRLTPGERLHNVAGAFAVCERNDLSGAHLVLVDDVVTTAATLNACAAALHDGGARIISYVTFGRAPAAGDRREEKVFA